VVISTALIKDWALGQWAASTQAG